ncbi:hypothetical protein [Mesorhizobium sp. LjRoot246]|uniref:hypothetical protein n=1 Tax=Mesorhizobium sp. LjRoot246 TaxID=3342294 RepID=UPI003ECC9DF9
MNEKKTFCDEKNSRIVHVGMMADDDYGGSHWGEGNVLRLDCFVVGTTRRDSRDGILRGLRAAADRLLRPFSHHTRLFHRI